ncbi:MAG: hypothetical protein SGJ23_09615 [Alphaproteobacteria bacterium]|nr:hypothetical protein [Alphaproteobacteria bacterium]
MDFGMLVVWAIAAVVVGAGLVSIVGALRRTTARPAHDGRSGDGGPIYGHGDGGRSGKDNDNSDGGDGGDGGGGD